MPISYFLAAVTSYLGLLLGIILVKLAPEEQKPGEKYFTLIKKILLLLILALFFIFSKINPTFLIILSVILLLFLLNKKITLENNILIYLLLGIIFSLSYNNIDLFTIESVLIFLYNVPVASLNYKIKKKNYKEIFVNNLWFFIPVMILYFI